MSITGSSITCKSCRNEFSGNYCNNCGEKVINRNDRTLRYFFAEFINAITFADNKLWNTLKLILLKPGFLSKEFVNGRRKPYMRPVSIFFLANLIYFLFPLINTFTTPLEIQKKAFIYSPIVEIWVEDKLESRDSTIEEFRILYNSKTTELSKLLLILFVLLLAIFFQPIHVGSKQKFFADHLTISLETMTFILFICVQLSGLMGLIMGSLGFKFLLTNFYSTIVAVALLCYFFYFMEVNFYGFKKLRAIVNVILCQVAIVLALLTYRGILFFITYWSV